jgi:hypothetical protein
MVAASLDVGSRDAASQDVARSADFMVAQFAAEGASTVVAADSTVEAQSTAAAASTVVAADTAAADTAKLISDRVGSKGRQVTLAGLAFSGSSSKPHTSWWFVAFP